MDLVTRLKLFLNQNGIANSQFADTCGIPRPSLSQLLNGRNKKVSDELISKVHAAYPSLNIMWLMFGDGDMYVGDENPILSQNAQLAENSKLGDAPKTVGENQNSGKAIAFGEGDLFEMAQAASETPAAKVIRETMQQATKKSHDSAAKSPADSSSGKRVVSIMVFYSDNSFESFGPLSH